MPNISAEAKQGYRAIRHSKAIDTLTRIGFLSKGIVYLLLGTLAVMAAMHSGGQTTDQNGVIEFIAGQPFGMFALVIIAAGLLAYSLWRYTCALSDVEGEGSDAKGLGKRAGYFLSGLAHTGIALSAIRIVIGNSEGQRGDAAQTWTARLMEFPGGSLLIGAIGVGVIAAGVMQFRKGLQERFKEDLQMSQMNASEQEMATKAGTLGHCARGVVFGLIGLFLVFAAWQTDPNQVQGLEGVLDKVAAQPFGRGMLALLAAGLGCYGVYCMVEAKYRRIRH